MLYNMDNIALRNFQFSVILYYKREIDAQHPIGLSISRAQ
jgi:hypothetical protein